MKRSDKNLTIQNQTIVDTDHNAWQMKLASIAEKEMTQKLLVWTIDGNMGYRIQYSAPAHRFTEYLTSSLTYIYNSTMISLKKYMAVAHFIEAIQLYKICQSGTKRIY